MKRILLVSLLATFAGCLDSYNPDLGDSPFLCGTEPPTCPAGYSDVWVSETRCECHPKGDQTSTPIDGNCADDSSREPNETFSEATVTPVGAGSSTVTIPEASICPSNDTDVYKLQVNTSGQNITVTVTPGTGIELACDILNSSGTPVVNCAGTSVLTAEHTAEFAGTYYARVKTGSPGVQGNYKLDLKVQ